MPGARTIMRCTLSRLYSPEAPEESGGTATIPDPNPDIDPSRQDYQTEDAVSTDADDSLSEVMETYGEETTPASKAESKKRGKDGKYTKAKEDLEVGAVTAPSESSPELDAARAALLRDGTYDEDDLSKMGEDAILKKGKKAAKRQKDIDEKMDGHQAVSRQLAELKRTLGTDDSNKPAVADQPDDIDAAIEKYLADQLMDDGTLSKLLSQRQAKSQGEVDSLRAEVLAIQDITVRGEVQKEYPGLKDPETYEQVRSKMETLALSGTHSDRLELMRESALLVLGPDMLKEAERKAKAARVQRDVSAEPATERQSPQDAPKTEDDKSVETLRDDALDAQMAGNTKEYERLRGLIYQKQMTP